MNVSENNAFWSILKSQGMLTTVDYDFWTAENQNLIQGPTKAPAKRSVKFAKKDKVRFISHKGNVKHGTIAKIGKTTAGTYAAAVVLDDKSKKVVNVLLSDLEKLV